MFLVYSEYLLYFNFLSWFHDIYIYIYIYIYYIFSLVFFNFLNIMISVYLSKYFKFKSAYNCGFSNFIYYKCLNSNASKYLKIMYKHFLKYASKHK